MSVAVDNAASAFLSSSASSLTLSSFVVGAGTNRLLVAFFVNTGNSATHCTGITYGGVSLTSLVTFPTPAATVVVDVFSLIAPASGTANVVYTLNGSTAKACAGVISFSGVDQATPLGTVATAGVTFSTAPSVTATVGSTDLVLDCGGGSWASGRTRTAGADQTQRVSLDNTVDTMAFCSTQLGSAGGVMSWTLSASSNWATTACAVHAAATASILQRRTLHTFDTHAGGRTMRGN